MASQKVVFLINLSSHVSVRTIFASALSELPKRTIFLQFEMLKCVGNEKEI